MKYDDIETYVDALFDGRHSSQPEPQPAAAHHDEAPADWDAEIEDLYFRGGFGPEDFDSKPAAQSSVHGSNEGTYYSESGTGAVYHQPAEATVSLGSALAWLVFLAGGLALIVALSEIGWI